MDNPLLTGIVLIVAGVALGILAYAILLNRREDGSPAATDAGPQSEASGSEAAAAAPSASAPPAAPPKEHPPVAVAPPPPPAAFAPARPVAPSEASPPSPPPTAAPLRPPAPSGPRPPLPVAFLLRDEVTGELIVRVGEREYRRAEDLRASSDWTRMEYTAAELQRWIQTARPAERKREAAREERAKKPLSMVEQINEILTRKMSETGRAGMGVRLVEAGGGAVQVYVGLQRYEMESIPDPEVRRIIREAVAEWESRP